MEELQTRIFPFQCSVKSWKKLKFLF